MTVNRALLGVGAFLVAQAAYASQADARGGLCKAELTGAVSTPADDSVHCSVDPATCAGGACACDVASYSPYNLEWWYFTGHLETVDTGRRFGFAEIVYAALDLESLLPLTWADHVVIDVAAKKYHFGGRETVVGLPLFVEDGFAFSFPRAEIRGDSGAASVRSEVVDPATGESFAVDLALSPRKAPVLQRADGLVSYYSRERLRAAGAIEYDGEVHPVTGEVWFDHQFGPQRDAYQNVRTWSWFALQLSGRRELVLYDVTMNENETRPEYAGGVKEGTFSDANCDVTRLGRDDFTITALGAWNSGWMPPGWGDLGCTYPMGWRVEVPSLGIDVEVRPHFEEQEIVVPEVPGVPLVGDRYWEGEAEVDGSHKGSAFVEMVGFCPFAPGPL